MCADETRKKKGKGSKGKQTLDPVSDEVNGDHPPAPALTEDSPSSSLVVVPDQSQTSDSSSPSFAGLPRNGALEEPPTPSSSTFTPVLSSLPGDPDAPLQRFSSAKKHMVDIYDDYLSFLSRMGLHLNSLPPRVDPVTHETKRHLNKENQDLAIKWASLVQQWKEAFEKNKGAVTREKMKAVFIGRTSQGKSTCINAILGSKVLPSGLGHTTNCFCFLTGTKKDTPYMTTNGSSVEKPIENLKLLANALSPEGVTSVDTKLSVFWPVAKCPILRYELEIIDSPGLDLSETNDAWIDKYCADSDVFLLIVNAMGALNKTEKGFFREIKKKVANPNIFLLYNHWDLIDEECDNDPEDEQQQHYLQAETFLVDDLNVYTKEEATERIYFISAKEALAKRNPLPAFGRQMSGNKEALNTEAAKTRFEDFESFEKSFEECISTSAIKTCFQHRAKEASQIGDGMVKELDEMGKLVWGYAKEIDAFLTTQTAAYNALLNRRGTLLSESEIEIQKVVERLRTRVEHMITTEIETSLGGIVMNYSGAFSVDTIPAYKSLLTEHVQTMLHQKLEAKIKAELAKAHTSLKNGVRSRVESVLPDVHKKELAAKLGPLPSPGLPLTPSRTSVSRFGGDFNLDCSSLSDTFKEDIEYRFRFSLEHLLGINPFIRGFFFRETSSAPSTPTSRHVDDSEYGLVVKMSMFDVAYRVLSSPGAPIVVTVATFVFSRMRALQFALIGAGAYWALYKVDYLLYTEKAKENKLKTQFVDHAKREFRSIARIASHYSTQTVNNDLNKALAILDEQMLSAEEQLSADIERSTSERDTLQAWKAKTDSLREVVGGIASKVSTFITKFLAFPSPHAS